MLNAKTEKLLLLCRATANVPGRPHASTLVRWASRGVAGVRLETVKIGGRRYTSAEAIDRFISRTSGRVSQRVERTNPSIDAALDAAGL